MSTHEDDFARTEKFDTSGLSDTSGTGVGTTQPSMLGDVADDPSTRPDDSTRWHGGLDLGLLVLRVVLGGTVFAHGLQKVFGLFNGPGIDGFAQGLGMQGFTSQTTLLAWITGISELGGGALLVLGLFTQLGASAALGVTASVVYLKFGGGFFNAGPGTGFEYELALAAIAFSLLFTGSGRLALDRNAPWRRKPMPLGLFGLLLAAAATVLVMVLCRR